ncbi:hypothetical protein VNO77_07261 [Canavalia gladiata]|uniref:Uncharacterized protein n=1 Tax=Canavalia gladiata TaxID=3824 RepID=A0AAN9MBA1_CANGL
MNHSGYNNYPQQQHSCGYDPSQIQMQPYDQSYAYQQYYAYDPQYAYFPNTPQPQFHYQSEPAPVHPPGVNPTASEPHQTGPSQYKGKGGRGGRPFRGGGRGRGHGGGGGRHIPSHSSGPTISNVPGAPAATGGTSVVEPSTVSAQTPLPKPAQAPAAPVQPPVPTRKACCEICKVECNTPEILEQHKNGKKHKKKMKMHEQLQICNTINGQQSGQIPTSQLNLTDQPKKVQESEKNGHPAQNVCSVGSEVIVDNHKEEKQLENNAGNISEVPAEVPEEKTTDNSAARGQGLKRKRKGGKGVKFMRTNDGSRSVEHPTPAQPPLKCELCDVKCESQAVYQSHMAGKKHLSRLKRAQASSGIDKQSSSGIDKQSSSGIDKQSSSGIGKQSSSGIGKQSSSGIGKQSSSGIDKQSSSGVEQAALSGGFFGLQALYPPDINALSNAINAQVQQGDNDPQVLLAQLLMTVLTQAQVPATAPVTGAVAAQVPAPTSVAGPSLEPQLQTQGSEITANVEMEKPSGEPKTEQVPVPLELNAQLGSSVSTQMEGGSSETENRC